MTKILYKATLVSSNVSSTTHTVNTGLLTESTDIENIYDRSVLRTYLFNKSSVFAVATLTINLTSVIDAEAIAILGAHPDTNIRSVELFYNTTLGSETTLISTRQREIDGTTYKDFVYSLDSDVAGTINKIVIEWDGEDVSDGYFSAVYVAENLLDVNIKPKSLKYQFASQGSKKRTEGGQINASKNNSYMRCSFATTATTETNVINKHFDINYVSSVSEPIIFIPQEGESILLYGTQEKPNSTALVEAKDPTSGQWYYETQFNLEEEF